MTQQKMLWILQCLVSVIVAAEVIQGCTLHAWRLQGEARDGTIKMKVKAVGDFTAACWPKLYQSYNEVLASEGVIKAVKLYLGEEI